MKEILHRYQRLLAGLDAWFARGLEASGDQARCRRGCSACCRGLFDITLLDAWYLQAGFRMLPAKLQGDLEEEARRRLADLGRAHPRLAPPYLLEGFCDTELSVMMPEADETPCLLLAPDGSCRLYGHRPMTCRLHGLPLFDHSGEAFHDEWCTLNFTGDDPSGIPELRWEFRRFFDEELTIFRELCVRLLGSPRSELDTLLPAALLIDFSDLSGKGRFSG